MSSPDLSIRANIQCALQEAADHFKQNNEAAAYRVLDEKVKVHFKEGRLSKEQLIFIYRSIVPDPLSPQTPFSQRQCIPVIGLKASALKDLVRFCCAEAPPTLKDGPAKQAILKAAELLETAGDEAGARRILDEVLLNSLSSSDTRIHKDVVLEVSKILSDSFRAPTSLFLKRHVEKNPLILDFNRLRAKALESVSMHLFDEEIAQEQMKAKALKDLVAFYSAAENPIALKDGPAKDAILKASGLLRVPGGDMAGAWKILQDVLPTSLRSNEDPIHEEIVKEVYKIMLDSTRLPTSSFLKEQVQSHQARGVVNETPSLAVLPRSIMTQNILSFAGSSDLAVVAKTAKPSLDHVKNSLKFRSEITLDDLKTLHKMGIVIDKGTFSALRCIRGKIETKEDVLNLLSVVLHCPKLETIELDAKKSKVEDHTDYLTAIGTHCPNLLKFALRDSKRQISIDPVVLGCNKIQHLDLRGTKLKSVREDKRPIQIIAENCPDLISIATIGVRASDLKSLVGNCKNLTQIVLYSFFEENDVTFEDPILYELANCTKLQSFSIRSPDLNHSHSRFSPSAIRAFAQGCKALSHLEFQDCVLEKGSLAEIGAARLPLKSLAIENCGVWTVEDIGPLAEGSPDLEILRINEGELDDDCLGAIGQHCHKIRTLNVLDSSVSEKTAEGVKAIAKGCPLLTNLSICKKTYCLNGWKFLQALVDSNCSITHANIQDSHSPAADILAFVRKNPGLTYLNLSNNDNVDDDLLLAISKLLPNLVSINLKHTNVTHIGISALGKECPKLKMLNASFLKKFNSVYSFTIPLHPGLLLKEISENFPRLTHLDISENPGPGRSGTPNYTSNELALLGKGCPDIEVLDVSSNNLRTRESDTISSSFFRLQLLNTSNNPSEPLDFNDGF